MKQSLTHDQDFGLVQIGRGTYWDEDSTPFLHYGVEPIIIGRYCSIASLVKIQGGGEHDFKNVSTWPFDNFLEGLPNPTRTYRIGRPTVIGSDVWIGLGAHIKSGVQIGHGVVVGGSAVISADVPPFAVVSGNPSAIRRRRFAPEQIESLLRIAWWNWSAAEVLERRAWFYRPIEAFLEAFDVTGAPSPDGAA